MDAVLLRNSTLIVSFVESSLGLNSIFQQTQQLTDDDMIMSSPSSSSLLLSRRLGVNDSFIFDQVDFETVREITKFTNLMCRVIFGPIVPIMILC
jgi:hypothetical protein